MAEQVSPWNRRFRRLPCAATSDQWRHGLPYSILYAAYLLFHLFHLFRNVGCTTV